MTKVICPYCEKRAKLITGEVIYPHREDLYKNHFYICDSCVATVGCHPGTTKPFGGLAKNHFELYEQKPIEFSTPYGKEESVHEKKRIFG